MIDLNKMKTQNGCFSHDGEAYTLIQPAHIDGTADAAYFTALAIKDSDTAHPDEDDCVDTYRAVWGILPGWDGEDGGDACSWDHPAEVSAYSAGFDVMDGITRG